jgi:cytochrome c biogenesis protein CcmG, thiol:disulfide interchange protein DsbE
MVESDTLKIRDRASPRVVSPVNTNKILLGLLGVTTACFLALVAWSMRETVTNEGDSAPAFSIRTDQGQEVTATNFGGKVLVLNFWATWCAPCVSEIPSLNALQKRLRSSGAVVLAVSIDKNDQKYRAFLNRFHVTFETARDPAADISSSYGTFQVPETFIIKDGKIVRKLIGEQNWTEDNTIDYIKGLL